MSRVATPQHIRETNNKYKQQQQQSSSKLLKIMKLPVIQIKRIKKQQNCA